MHNILKINFRRYFNNKILSAATAAFYVFTVVYLIYSFVFNHLSGDTVFKYIYTLRQTDSFSIYSFAFFAFVSFEFSSEIYSSKAYEAAVCTAKKLCSLFFNNTAVLSALNLFYGYILIIINIFAFCAVHSFDGAYTLHIFLNIAVNFFLANTFAVLFGEAVSFLKKRILAYIFLIFFILISSNIGEAIAANVVIASDNTINSYLIYNLFNIFVPNLDRTPIYAMGFSVLPYRIYLILFWAFLMLAILLLFLKGKKYAPKSILCFVLSCFCAVSFYLPSSRVVLNYDPNGEAMADQYYYDGIGETEYRAADFSVEKYEMKLTVKRQLNAAVTMYLVGQPGEYSFTLYHGYTVKAVTDGGGNPLDFIRDGDYITVKPDSEISSVAIKYSGSGKGFYSNYQGIYLPGDFPYYPVAGKKQIRAADGEGDNTPVTPDNTPYFEIKVSSALTVFSNLASSAAGSFSGYSKSPCLFAGFLKAEKHGEITIVYPYLFGEADYLDQIFETIDTDKYSGKVIFIEPNTNVSIDDGFRIYDDVVLCDGLGYLTLDGEEEQ